MSDSIYSFTFYSTLLGKHTGDVWSGFVTADTGTYATNQSFYSPRPAGTPTPRADGIYVITGETPYNVDLSAAGYGGGYEDGMVWVTTYYDGKDAVSYKPFEKGINLSLYSLASAPYPYGVNYLGSEAGHVITLSGGGRTDFGLNSTTAQFDSIWG